MNNLGIIDLENLLLTIFDEEVKKLMKEAMICYNVGAYRAAIILTWNTVLYDTYKKISYLAKYFEDNEAQEIQEDIEKKLNEGKYFSEWNLIEEYLYKKLDLIDKVDCKKLSFIKDLRNMSAHLSMHLLKEEFFTPTAEDVRMVIRNAIEIILSQPPILNKKATKYLFKEILGPYFPTLYEKFEKIVIEEYLEKGGKYFLRNLVIETIERYLFGEAKHENLKNLFLVLLRHKQKYFEDEAVKKCLNKIASTKEIEKLIWIIIEEPEILNYISKGKEVLIKYLEEQLTIFDDLPQWKREFFPILFIIFKFQMGKNDYESVKEITKKYIEYINLFELQKYNIYIKYFNEELKEIFLESSIEHLKNLSWFDGAYKFIRNTISPLLYLVTDSGQLKTLFTNIEENKGRGKINQILESSHALENVEIILKNISKDILRENKKIVETFLDNVCLRLTNTGFFDKDIKECKRYFFDELLN
ncbi:hypothetical protein [Marinitoga aeolica]|uniref:DUF4145 domain-containing protein n=1 Tax=Marinitoga aeolica TaxID=2809031 RepID=A0ABY8PMW5_9BACT|nr:hypothetical protein [Marinitoga aeolica]WGS63940.1 hypothetical protein JRV97_06050 [Marinitoga aeolica]